MSPSPPTTTERDLPRLHAPAPQRLAAAKLALLEDAEETKVMRAQKANQDGPMDAVTDAIRQKPLVFAGLAAVLGFFIVQRSFFVKRLITLFSAKLVMTAVKRALK